MCEKRAGSVRTTRRTQHCPRVIRTLALRTRTSHYTSDVIGKLSRGSALGFVHRRMPTCSCHRVVTLCATKQFVASAARSLRQPLCRAGLLLAMLIY